MTFLRPGQMGRPRHLLPLFGILSVLLAGSAAVPPSGAQATARSELVTQRTATAKVFQEPDGSYTAEIHSIPIHYKDGTGAWQEIDPTLVPSGAPGKLWQNTGAAAKLEFAAPGSLGDLVSVSAGQLKLGFSLTGASPIAPAPSVSGTQITYSNIQPNVDLAFDSRPDALKEEIVLKRAPTGPLSFSFPLSISGLSTRSEATGEVSLLDVAGKLQFALPKAWMADSAPTATGGAVSGQVSYSIGKAGGQTVLKVTPDLAWLQSPARVYPVSIDPTVTFTPTLKTFVRSNLSTPQSTATTLEVGSPDAGATKSRTLFQYDLSSLSGKQIVSASLSAWESYSYSCTASQVNVLRITSAWNANTIWSNQPSTDPTVLSSATMAHGFNGSCPAGRYSLGTVTQTVTNWVAGTQPNYGMELVAANESASVGWKKFAWDIGLSVNYNTAPAVPTSLTPADGTFATSTTPTLSGIYTDTDAGASGHLDFEVYRSSNNVLVASGSSPNVVSTSRAQWTVMAGALVHGIAYYWRARANDGQATSAWTSNVSYLPDTIPTVSESTPSDTATVQTREPALEASASDIDADPISYQFQVARDAGFTDIVGTSEWLPGTKNFGVPDSWFLKDQATYRWRVRAQDGPGVMTAWTAGRSFKIGLQPFGIHDYYPMWSHGPVAVNEATGNLILSAPTPSYPSAVDPLHIDITFNSQNSKNEGLGKGWTLGGSPSKIVDLRYAPPSDQQNAVLVTFDDGSTAQYDRVGDTGNFIPESNDGSTLTETDDGTYTLELADGTIYTYTTPDPTTGEATLSNVEYSESSNGLGKLRYAYTSGKLTSITDEGNRTLTLNWNSLDPASCNVALCVQGPDGVVWKYTTSENRIVRVNDGSRDVMALTYDGLGRIIKIQNADDLDPGAASPGYNANHAITIGYDTTGHRAGSVSDGPITNQMPATATWTFDYSSGGVTAPTQAVHGSLPAGSTRPAAGYTTMTPPRQQGQPSPKRASVYYDDLNHPIEGISVLGAVTQAAYDGRDQLLWTEDADGNPTDYSYDGFSNTLTSVTGPDPDGAGPLARPTTQSRYDEAQIGSAGAPGAAVQGLQARYYSSFEFKGQPTKTQTDAKVDFNWGNGGPAALAGRADSFSVRWSGNLAVPADSTYVFSVVADDQSELTVDGYQLVNDQTNDGVTTLPARPIHLTAGLHRLILTHQENNGTAEIHLQWSCEHCTPAINDQVIPASSFQPAWLNLTSTVTALGRVSFSHFTNPGSGKPDYELARLGDGTNIITSFTYDDHGRRTQMVMPKGNAGRSIDAQGNLQGAPDVTYSADYTYYASNGLAAPPAACGGGAAVHQSQQLASKTPHGLATTTYVYDVAGNMVASTNGAGTTCRSYDAARRLVSARAPGDPQAITYGYDPVGQLRTAISGVGTLTSAYDEAGRLTRTIDSFGAEATFAYDSEGNIVLRTAAAGALAANPNFSTQYGYDDANLNTSVIDPAGRVYQFSYDRRGNLKTTQYPNGTFTWADYNGAGWLSGLFNRHGVLPTPLPASVPNDSQSNPLSDHTYVYNLEGRKTQEVRSGGGLSTATTNYTYDELGRIASFTLPSGVQRVYSYDRDSNRLTTVENGLTTNYTYNPVVTAGLDELTSSAKAGQTTTYGYSADGQVTTRGADSLTWDGWGRFAGGTFGGTGISYSFDAAGVRRQRTMGGQTTRYLLGGLFEADATGAIAATEVDGPQAGVARYNGPPSNLSAVTFAYFNGHGDLAAEADAAGARTATYSYDPFGQPNESVPTGVTVERWAGRWHKKLDTAAGLIEMGSRTYDSSLGRFLSVDPVEGGSLNLYDYANQDPVNLYDLSGSMTEYKCEAERGGDSMPDCNHIRYAWCVQNARTLRICYGPDTRVPRWLRGCWAGSVGGMVLDVAKTLRRRGVKKITRAAIKLAIRDLDLPVFLVGGCAVGVLIEYYGTPF